MRKILSQDEIDLLLASPGGEAEPRGTQQVAAYNFRRPDRVSKDQIRSLHFLHDRFARNLTTSLSVYLRTGTEISIVGVEQSAYSEFLMALPDPTAFYAVSLAPFEVLGAFELNPSVAFSMVDRMLGGTGETGSIQRALTEIELNVVDSVVRLLLDQLSETWKPVAEVKFQIQGRETRPQMLQVAAWNEVVIQLTFDIKVGDSRGLLHLCVPASVIEGSGTNFIQSWQHTQRTPTATEQRWLSETLGQMPLSVTTSVETRFRARDLLQLKAGEVITLGVPASASVDVRVGEHVKFKGRLMAHGGRAAVLVERAARPITDAQGETA